MGSIEDTEPDESPVGRMHRRRGYPTLRDVADETGLALSTVSRALSKPGRVRAETATLVREVAERIGYRVGSLPPLGTKRKGLIGLVLTDVANPFFAQLMRGAREAALESGNILVILDAQESPTAERQALEHVIPSVDGVILATSRMSDNAVRMIAKQVPLVILNRHVLGVPSLIVNTDSGMRQALNRLSELGHRRVVYLAGPEASWASGARWRVLQDVAAELRMVVSTTAATHPTERGGGSAMHSVLRSGASAVLCFNDLMAIGLVQELQLHGCAVPTEISIVGWDNIRGGEWLQPKLSTIASPQRALGLNGVRELLNFMSIGTPRVDRPVVLPSKFIARDSIAGAPASKPSLRS